MTRPVVNGTQPKVPLSDRSAHARLALAAICVAALFSVYVHARSPLLPYDDAFITYRYVDHLVHGEGLVFNAGERVYGFTPPAYVLTLALVAAIVRTVPLPTVASVINAAWFIAGGIAIFLFCRRATNHPLASAAVAVAVLVNPALLAISRGGMEPFMGVALTFLALTLALERRAGAAGSIAALAVLTRPEAIVIVPPLLLYFLRDRAAIVRLLTGFAIPLVAWLGFAGLYFHSIVPLPVVAKLARLYPLPAGAAVIDLTKAAVAAMTPFPLVPTATLSTAVGIVLAVVAICALGMVRGRGAWLAPCALLLLLAGYAIGNPLVFPWYWPLFLCLIHVSLLLLGTWVGTLTRAAWPIALTTLWLAGCTGAAYVFPRTGLNQPFFSADDAEWRRVDAYREAAARLNAARVAGDVVAGPEVGALGFYLQGRLVDACALVSPEALRYLPVPAEQRLAPDVGAISINFVAGVAPDWVVTLPLFAARSLMVSEWFAARYSLWARVPLDKPLWGSADLLIYRKRPSGTTPVIGDMDARNRLTESSFDRLR